MTLAQLIQERNEIQLHSECRSEDEAIECWRQLGVANWHIERVVAGTLSLTPAVEREITQCFQSVREWQRKASQTVTQQ